MSRTDLPKISIVIPTYNEEKHIGKALRSIFQQRYPRNKLEVIIVDDDSTDRTKKIAKKFPVKIFRNGYHDGEVGKIIGLRRATGDYFYYYDADMELKGKNFFQSMIYPFTQEKNIVGVFTRNYSKKSSPSLERYFAMDPIHRDPIYEMFSPSVESTIVDRKLGYKICKYTIDKVPPAARCLYPMKYIKKMTQHDAKFLELDLLIRAVKKGKNTFAYVELPGKYHHHAESLTQLILKRKRNVTKVYLTTIDKREYIWFDLKNPRDLLKIIILIIYANTFIFATLRGVYKSIRHKDIAGMWEPVVSFVVTDIIIFSFLFSKRGLEFIFTRLFGKLNAI